MPGNSEKKVNQFDSLIDFYVKKEIGEIPEEFSISVPDDILKEYLGSSFVDDGDKHITSEYFLRVSLPVAFDNRLTPNDKLVFGFLETLLKFYRYAYPSSGYIADILGICRKTVQTSLKKLASLNLIYILEIEGGKRVYFLSDLDEVYPELIESFKPRHSGWSVFAMMRKALKDYFKGIEVVKFTPPIRKSYLSQKKSSSHKGKKECLPIEKEFKRESLLDKEEIISDSQTSFVNSPIILEGLRSPLSSVPTREEINQSSVGENETGVCNA